MVGPSDLLGRRHGPPAQSQLVSVGVVTTTTWLSMRSSSGPAPAPDHRILVDGVAVGAAEEDQPDLALLVDRRLVGLHHGHAPRGHQVVDVAAGLVVLVGLVARRLVAAARDGRLDHHLALELAAAGRVLHPGVGHDRDARVRQLRAGSACPGSSAGWRGS